MASSSQRLTRRETQAVYAALRYLTQWTSDDLAEHLELDEETTAAFYTAVDKFTLKAGS